MIRVKKVGELYEATAPNRKGRELRVGPMSAGDLMRTLNNEGYHHTDIGDALYRADPEWAGPIPRLTDEQREQVREVFARWGVGRVARRKVVDFDSEIFLVHPDDSGSIRFGKTVIQGQGDLSDDVLSIESEVAAIFPDRKRVVVRLQNQDWLALPQEEV